MYANCDDSKQTLEVQGFKRLSVPEGRTVTTQNHVIQTSTKYVVGYDVEIEMMELKLENRIDDSTLNTEQLFQIVSQAVDSGEKLTMTDIKKRYQLEKLHRNNKNASVWIYSVSGVIVLLIGALTCWQARKKN